VPTRLHRYDVPGHTHFWTFSTYRRLTFFWHDDIKHVALDGLRHLQSKFNICLVGYVIMPEHMHIRTRKGTPRRFPSPSSSMPSREK
jgi:REP element-mobilizing transposase RayT